VFFSFCFVLCSFVVVSFVLCLCLFFFRVVRLCCFLSVGFVLLVVVFVLFCLFVCVFISLTLFSFVFISTCFCFVFVVVFVKQRKKFNAGWGNPPLVSFCTSGIKSLKKRLRRGCASLVVSTACVA